MVTEKVLVSEAYSLKSNAGIPLLVEVPLLPDHIPCLVSTAKPGVFVLVKKLSQSGSYRCGIFPHSSANHDRYLEVALKNIYDYCVSVNSVNVFVDLAAAVRYIRDQGDFTDEETILISGPDFITTDTTKHLGVKHLPLSLDFDVVFSVPEFVGMNLVFPGNAHSGVVFHNIFKGLAFVTRTKSA
jgi:hypothetical protein